MVQNTVFTIIYSSRIPSSTSEALVLFIYLFKVAWTKSFIDLTVSFAYGFPHMFRLAMLASRSFGARRQPSLLWNLLVAQTFLARMWRSATLTWHIVCVWIPRPQLRFAFHVYFFFFSCSAHNGWQVSAPMHYSRVPQITLFNNFFIKNRSHSTIYTFKNYFATVLSVSVFSFKKNKLRVRLDWIYCCWNWKLKTENTIAK